MNSERQGQRPLQMNSTRQGRGSLSTERVISTAAIVYKTGKLGRSPL